MTSTTYHVKPVQVVCRDRFTLGATVFSPGTDAPEGVVIICAALGVGQNFYHHFAAFLCEKGFCAVTFDYRGTGDSRTDAPFYQLALQDWGVRDINAMIEFAGTLPGSDNIFLTGHSVGGQVFCLAEKSETLSGVILVAASFPFWKRWDLPRKYLMYLFFHILIPVLGTGKQFPAKRLGLSNENLPASLVKDWGRWARHPDYLTAEPFGLNTDRFKTLAIPMLSLGFSDDTYVPKKAIHRFHQAFEKADINDVFIDVKKGSHGHIGHFGFFRKGRTPDLWEKAVSWMAKCAMEKEE